MEIVHPFHDMYTSFLAVVPLSRFLSHVPIHFVLSLSLFVSLYCRVAKSFPDESMREVSNTHDTALASACKTVGVCVSPYNMAVS